MTQVQKARAGLLSAIILALCCAGSAFAAGLPEPLDGPKRVFQDDLLDHMTGSWTMTGALVGEPIRHDVEVHWILNHQFLEIHELDTAPVRGGGPAYEAMPIIGYDNASERYIAHWIDIYGGRFSETLGYGKRTGDTIEFVFEYPDGPFHTALRWLPDRQQWQWLMTRKNADGKWVGFAEMTLKRRTSN
jgi:hypothetical protein